jgi:precorrin-2/cobalt-factor-2 C20-methyltransferase
MKGKAYGVGVGPGDPELMTLKAVRLITEKDIIMVPGTNPQESVAYKIAVQAVPELENKTVVPVDLPMLKDREELKRSHRKGAELIESYLNKGNDVVFLTLGDSTVYCTFTYIQEILKEDGYETELVNGITSFCAAASRLNIPLAEWNEPIHIIPAVHKANDELDLDGNYVLMKSGSHMKDIKERLVSKGRDVKAVVNCGMETEEVYQKAEDIPDETGYFTLLISKEV